MSTVLEEHDYIEQRLRAVAICGHCAKHDKLTGFSDIATEALHGKGWRVIKTGQLVCGECIETYAHEVL